MTFQSCFDHQLVLLHQFHAIERENLPHTYKPISGNYFFVESDFETYAGQQRLRELGSRITEEVCEILHADTFGLGVDKVHEEIADAFHFLIEFYLVCGLQAHDFQTSLNFDPLYSIQLEVVEQADYDRSDVRWGLFLMRFGMTLNLLKTRPWKKSPKPFDFNLFKEGLLASLRAFVSASFYSGLPVPELINRYFNKAAVNQQRIDTGV